MISPAHRIALPAPQIEFTPAAAAWPGFFRALSFGVTPAHANSISLAVVDGFLLAYPLNPNMEHKYSTAQNLETVLAAFRSTVP
jgi:hypothetical protein